MIYKVALITAEFLMRFTGLALFTLMLWVSSPAAHAAGGGLALKDSMAPHKALYDIKMVSKSSGSQILNISGQMFYEWQPGCEAWLTDHRFNLFYEYADSPPIRITSDFSTYETYDGKTLDYSSRRKRNGEIYQEIRGQAVTGDDGGGRALYTIPEGLAFDLAPGTMFPMAHSLEVLALARQGKKFFSAVIFDGSDEEGPVEINSFVGKKTAAPAEALDRKGIDKGLLESPAWQVRMAFFPLQDENTDAEYEMDVVFHENGVISDMLVEYRDFSVTQKLAALERIAPAPCPPAPQ